MTHSPVPVAIPTTYNGYKFRSRLEARWAVFLDSLGERFDYEVEGFNLPSGPYLPDYWLPRLNLWLEVKGPPPTAVEQRRCEELSVATGFPVVLVAGMPHEPLFLHRFAGEWSPVAVGQVGGRLAFCAPNVRRPLPRCHFDLAKAARFERADLVATEASAAAMGRAYLLPDFDAMTFDPSAVQFGQYDPDDADD